MTPRLWLLTRVEMSSGFRSAATIHIKVLRCLVVSDIGLRIPSMYLTSYAMQIIMAAWVGMSRSIRPSTQSSMRFPSQSKMSFLHGRSSWRCLARRWVAHGQTR